ncbi:ATP-grasp domain-containing protein [Salisediminibacterium halotolerans]|uniref:ATP-grasp domain-containing protein n=1 Tax=Salisediminibacterium halotolerans TaxID=517425 RepID=UPI000EB2308B|nr:ATP-grasp domain-containing protein [Salisediminibacterium halotolerans]RLJ75719.1 carbamoyl-phosphate synthase large subunit [Actinophytocola xinjiangensis]RPE89573.1 carbamoyl-phosphate synthase large subunit [Salisediminibacterium halotolerans]TWG36332.1 carbamoyl-phosphate synthase large subunit [Salisediminibacterium halotolerans]GEL07220.1 carbamoyl phosphate synthase [Salisediminibacterium halotolerans]
MNMLILSCGTRNKIVQYFVQEFKGFGEVIATDCSEMAPAIYDADKYYIVPTIDSDGYLDTILQICHDNNVSMVTSLIDPELSVLAKHKERFNNLGTEVLVSRSELTDLCLDKYAFHNDLKKNSFPVVPTALNTSYDQIKNDLGDFEYPLFAKPRDGSASVNMQMIHSSEDLDAILNTDNDIVIQKYMQGKEFGIDVYVDLVSQELVSMFIKEKVKMRAGETDKSIALKNDKILELIKSFVESYQFTGVMDVDLFEVDDQYFISEVNPRFGGGYPHAYESGLNFPKYILNNIQKASNKQELKNYSEGSAMMKYNEVKIVHYDDSKITVDN